MWSLGPEERLVEWRAFREHLCSLTKKDAIHETALLWSKAPISNQCLAADLITDWPDPWELIHYNHYDDISITLGMVYTLTLSTDRFNDVIIKVLTDINNNTNYHTAWLDDSKYILNYEYNVVAILSDLSTDLRVKYKYSYEDLAIAKYK
jgi:hypothetical protein